MKKAMLLAAGLLVLAVLPGCGEVPQEAPRQTVPAATETFPAQQEATLTVYVSDSDGMHVVPRTLKVAARDKTVKNALFQMIQLDRASQYRVLPTGLSVLGVDVKDGTCVIDLSKEAKNFSGGTTMENLFLAMFVNTATEFPNVKEVTFRVEGKELTKFAGHYDMTLPYKRDESLIRMEKK